MKGSKGSIILSIIFMTLIIFLGLSLLNFTIIHNRVIKARNIHQSRSDSLHNTLIRHLHIDMNKIKSTKFKSSIEDCNNLFNNNVYPDTKENTISIKKAFSFTLREFPMFKMIRGVFDLETIDQSKRHSWKSSSVFTIFSGDVPVNVIPGIINPPCQANIDEENIYTDLQSIENGHIFVSNHESVFDISSYLAYILKIDPTGMTLDSIMELFENPDNSDGIFFVESEFNIGPVFVQGDVESITLSSKNDFQIIEMITPESYFRIQYSTDGYIYQSKHMSGSGDTSFNQKIIINGNVNILQGAGTPALASDARPEFIVLGDVNIFSSITGIRGSVPDRSASGITIIAASSPFSENNRSPILTFRSSRTVNIDGSINVKGIVRNEDSEVIIKGNLYCRELKNSGKIRIDNISTCTPISSCNFYLSNFSFIREFRTEQIEECFDNE